MGFMDSYENKNEVKGFQTAKQLKNFQVMNSRYEV